MPSDTPKERAKNKRKTTKRKAVKIAVGRGKQRKKTKKT